MIGDHRRREETGDLEPAVTVRRTHHGNLDAHVAQSSDAICPVSFDWGAPFELEAKFGEEVNGGVEVFYHDADVVHALDRHDVSLACYCGEAASTPFSVSPGTLGLRISRASPCRFAPSASPTAWPPQSGTDNSSAARESAPRRRA